MANLYNNSSSTNLFVNATQARKVTTDPTKLDQLNYVKKYFEDRGYGVSVVTNTASNNTISWNISW